MSGYRLGEYALKKRFMICLITLTLCFSNILPASAENYVNADFEINILEALGLAEGIKFDEIAYVTVEQFGIIMSKIAGYEEGDLEAAEMLGFIDYYDDGQINPESRIRYRNVLLSIIKLLGYDQQIALSNTGYGQIYGIAAGLGITRGINAMPDDTVSGALLAKLLYRSLDVPLMQRVSYGQTYRIEISRNKTILTENHNIYKGKGQITANDITSVTGLGRIGKGFVKIDGDLLVNVGTTDAKYLLGYYADFYYLTDKVTDEKTLLWINADEQRNNELFLKTEDISAYDDFRYTYYTDEEKTQHAIIHRGASVVYNGVVVDASKLTAVHFVPEYGDVTLLDTDNDGLFDVVSIMNYEAGIISSVNKNNNTLYISVADTEEVDGATKYIFTTKTIKLDNYVNIEMVDKEFKDVNIDNIYINDAIWWAQSFEGNMMTIIVSKDTVDGTIEEMEFLGDSVKLKIRDNHYNTFKDIQKYYHLGIGVSGVFRLDIEGKIIWVETSGDETMNFAYMIMGKISSGIERALELKLFDGEMKSLMCDSKVIIDGKTYTSAEEMLALFINTVKKDGEDVEVFAESLIRYSVNARGRINTIETPSDTPPNDGGADKLYVEAALPRAGSASTLYYVQNMGNWFGNLFGIDDNAKVFSLPSDRQDDSGYSLSGPEVFRAEGSFYGVTGYNIKADAERVIAVVYDGVKTFGSNVSSENMQIITKINKAVSDDGIELWKVYYTDGKTENSVTTDVEERIEGIRPGDMVRLDRSAKGELTAISLGFDTNNKQILNSYNTRPYTDKLRIEYGQIIRKRGNTVVLSTISKPRPEFITNEVIPVNYSNIIICEKTLNGINVYASRPDDVRVGDHLVYQSSYVTIKNIFIYRGWDW